MKAVKIFYYIIVPICLIFEIIAIAVPGISTLTTGAQYFFALRVVTVVSVGYVLGHMLSPIPWVLKIWWSLGILAGLILVAEVLSIWFKIIPMFWYLVCFPMGIIFWSTGTKGKWFSRRKK